MKKKKANLTQKILNSGLNLLVIISLVFNGYYPLSALAQENAVLAGASEVYTLIDVKELDNSLQSESDLAPINNAAGIEQMAEPEVKPSKVIKVAVITFYTSTKDQTDSTPEISASGKKVYDGMIAANCLPFGAKVKIPSVFGDKIFTVHDRMNRRYGCNRFDVWLPSSRQEALKMGVKKAEVEVYLEALKLTKLDE